MESKQISTITKVRQICCAGLPSRSFMPMVIAELRASIPMAACQFIWSNESGRVINAWSDTFQPRRAAWIILHRKQYEIDAGMTYQDLVLFGKPTGNLRFWWDSGFDATASYAALFERYGYKWFLDGIVRDSMRPYGNFGLIRNRDDPDFTAAEESLLARVLPYVAHAMRVDVSRAPKFIRAAGQSALIVCDAGGDVIEWSRQAHQLAVFALVDSITYEAEVAHGDLGEMRTALKDIVLLLRKRIDENVAGAELPALVRRNGWGEFVFRGYRLSGSRGPSDRIGILIEQLVPFEAHLLERVNATELSTRQKEIALLSAKGVPNAELARRLNITPNTLKDYFKAIYARLEINSHHQLVERLSADQPIAVG
ncbi:helix-turn-helix transcriptional regulator [Variovorax sp. LjRoot84]